MGLIEEGYTPFDFSETSNSDFLKIGAYIFERDLSSRFKFRKDLFIMTNYFLDQEDENFKQDAYKHFNSYSSYQLFINCARPFNELPPINITPYSQPVLGIMFNMDFFINMNEYIQMYDTRKYLELIKEFTFGNKAVEEALK